MPYYHATLFRTKATAILAEGLRTDVPRLWEQYAKSIYPDSYEKFVYLTDSPEDSAMWVLSYLIASSEPNKRDAFGFPHTNFREFGPESITIFDIDPTGLKVMKGFAEDFIVEGGVPPQNLTINGIIDPWEVWQLAELHHLFRTDGYLKSPYYGSGSFLGVEFNNRKIPPKDKKEIMIDRIKYRINRGDGA